MREASQEFTSSGYVPKLRRFGGIFPVGVALLNRAIEDKVAMFSELSLAVRWWGTPKYYE